MHVDEKETFYVRHTRPFFGLIGQDTEIRLDAEMPKAIRFLRVAPIWQTNDEYKHALQHRDEVSLKIKSDVLQPYL